MKAKAKIALAEVLKALRSERQKLEDDLARIEQDIEVVERKLLEAS
jgi:flagellar motility protein MotE (MotC chaperone)